MRWSRKNSIFEKFAPDGALLNLARSGVYRPKAEAGADDLVLMRRIDELHLELPFYGSRRMLFELNKEGRGLNRKRVQRLMRVMGIDQMKRGHMTNRAENCPFKA